VPEAAHPLERARLAILAEEVNLVSEPGKRLREACVVDIAAGPSQQVAVEDQDLDRCRLRGFRRFEAPASRQWSILSAPVNPRQMYRLRAPASGREAIAPVEPGAVYVDRETGEEMRPVTRTLPLAPSASALLRSPENLRICRRCDQLIGLDVSDCPYCGLRQPALDGGS
jgi:hypothetical protein